MVHQPEPKISKLLNKTKQSSSISCRQYYLQRKLTHHCMHNQSCDLSLLTSLGHFGEQAWKQCTLELEADHWSIYCLFNWIWKKRISVATLFEIFASRNTFTLLNLLGIFYLKLCLKSSSYWRNRNQMVWLLSWSGKHNQTKLLKQNEKMRETV
jgi:hypothetical protein